MRVKTEARREAIIEIATKVFLESGYERTSMAQIAEQLGGSKGTLYSYFPSKGDLFVEVILKMGREEFEAVFNLLDPDKAGRTDLRALLRRFGETFLSTCCKPDFVAAWRAVISEAGQSDIGVKFYEAGPKLGEDQVAAYLSAEMKAGRLREAAPDLAARQLIALIEHDAMLRCMVLMQSRITKEEIKRMVDSGVSTFLAAYERRDLPVA